MFFDGTLQEGIAAAVQQAKMVVSFVTDGGEESTKWEEEYLVDDSIKTVLSTQAVVLRLQAGSEEAKYLAAIFPLPKTPTLVLIRNGELKEYIASGVSKDDFMARLQKALGVAQPAPAAPAAVANPDESYPAQYAAGHRSTAGGLDSVIQSGSSTSNLAQANTPISTSHVASGNRTAETQPQSTGAAASKQPDKGKGRAQPAAEDPTPGKAQVEVQKAAEIIKKRKKEANEDRRRILEKIEYDRAERKAREEERRAERRALREGTPVDTGAAAPATVAIPKTQASRTASEICALQVRDFDGSTIRTRLPSSGTLRKDVREWVDANRSPNGSGPYLFKLVLTPLPNRTIDETEEDKTLLDLELAPSATLILVPVPRFTSAYGGGGGYRRGHGGIVDRINALFVAVMSIFNGFFGMFGRLLTGPPQITQGDAGIEMDELDQNQAQPPQGSSTGRRSPPGSARNRSDNSRVTGFRNPDDDRRDQQLYNGNSLNFEPRPDDE
ncbi:hypothetical protein MCOR27_005794 [Pyricularia oryzae]|uniref:UBX domain-containing protein 2 n=1 Tax=Pyricularia grisea TaxID=148305 RepID=A0ABQ8NZC3_PYRGI|nr:hypothetical protein MCOR01_009708 [Pyricularia oryzae]KAI6304291.1 hypothetical protein MCOR33_000602 [Pyricularia grisea]KAH9437004.1 hypothetical protein MCOR02_000666 [Pyricularia oryzae]KAI6260052.1 hypothetical protein MCOR19_003668 [Pyricularia oryzae]KAI6278042.1 hypothetical protein MCOR27_005794 [Pyricularia oryzae]